MFDRIAIFTAFILMLTSHKRYRNIALVLFLWLLISDLCHTYVLLDLRSDNNWIIYLLYSCINGATIFALKTLNSHILPICLLSVNILLNIPIAFYFVSDHIPYSVYTSYSCLAGSIVLLALIYMRGLHYGDRLKRRENDNSNIINLLFSVNK